MCYWDCSTKRLTIDSRLDGTDSTSQRTDVIHHLEFLGPDAANQLLLELGFQLQSLSVQHWDEVVAVRRRLASQLLTQLGLVAPLGLRLLPQTYDNLARCVV